MVNHLLETSHPLSSSALRLYVAVPSFHSPYTLPSSVSRNSFVCHSYENTRGCGGILPILECADVHTVRTFRPRLPRSSGAEIPTRPGRFDVLPCYYRRCCQRFSQESEPGMTARTLDGKIIRDQIFAELKDEVRILTSAGVRPGLAAVLVALARRLASPALSSPRRPLLLLSKCSP